MPTRVDGLASPLDAQLARARRESHEATVANRKRIETLYTTLDWTDKAITVIEIVTLVGTAKVLFQQTAKRLIAKGLSRAAAHSAATAFTLAHLATAAASAAVLGGVIPEVLVGAGLDEADVRAGLAVFRAFFTIVGLRGRGATGSKSIPKKACETSKETSPRRRHCRVGSHSSSHRGRA